MKLTKGMFKKMIKEEIEELSTEMRWGGYSDGLRDALVQLERMIPTHLGIEEEDLNITVDEWGPTEYDEPAGGEIKISWELHPLEATSLSEASLADEDRKSIGDTWEEKNQSARAAVFELAKLYDDPINKFEELDAAGHRHKLLEAFIKDFKDRKNPNNLVSELQSFAVIVMAKAFALYSGQ